MHTQYTYPTCVLLFLSLMDYRFLAHHSKKISAEHSCALSTVDVTQRLLRHNNHTKYQNKNCVHFQPLINIQS